MTAQEYLSNKGLSVEDGYMTDTSTDTGEYLTQEEVCVLMEQYAKQRQGVVPHDTAVSLQEAESMGGEVVKMGTMYIDDEMLTGLFVMCDPDEFNNVTVNLLYRDVKVIPKDLTN